MPRLRVNPLPEADSLQCRLCGKTFDQKKRLERHFNSHNDNRVRNYKCVLCDARFFETCHLDNHLRTHTGERPFKCEDCGKAYTQLSAKNRHRRTAHKHPEDQKPLESSERKTLDELNPLGEKEKTLAERKTIVIGSTTITPTGAGCASTGVSSVGTMTSLCSCPVGTNKNQHHKGEQHDSEVECALMGLSVAPSESSTLEDGTMVTLVTIPASAVDNLLSTGERVVTLALTGNGGSSGQQYRLVAASGSSTHRQALPSSITITGPSTSSTQQFEVDESTAKLLLGEYDESDEHDVKPIIVLASSPESGQVTFVSSSGDELFKNSTIIATGPVVTSAIPATKPTTVTSGTNFRPLLPRPSVSSSNQARTIRTVQPVKREYVQNDHHYSKVRVVGTVSGTRQVASGTSASYRQTSFC